MRTALVCAVLAACVVLCSCGDSVVELTDAGEYCRMWDLAENREWDPASDGHQWSSRLFPADVVAQYQREYRVTNILPHEDGALLRIIADDKPAETATAAFPTLEDRYLCVFGE